jgi:hypothetical protein
MDEVFGKNELSWSKLGHIECPFYSEDFLRAELTYKN